MEKGRNNHSFLKNKITTCAKQINVPKIDEWSILGIATALSGKRQDGDSELACPTPILKMSYYSIPPYLLNHSNLSPRAESLSGRGTRKHASRAQQLSISDISVFKF